MKKFISGLTTTLSILFVVTAIPVTLYILQNQKFDFQINAFLSDEPQSVKVVDITGSSAYITWMTEKSVIGMVKIGNDSANVVVETESTNFHALFVKNLQPGKEFAFTLLSDGIEYPSADYKFTTASILDEVGATYLIYGQVFSKDGSSIQPAGLVYVQLKDGNTYSEKIPALLNKAGGFQINLTGTMDSAHVSLFDFKKSVDVYVEVFYEVGQPAITKMFTIDLATNHQIPNVYLGDINIDVIPGINGD